MNSTKCLRCQLPSPFGPDQRAANMTDSKYFTTTKKGEIFELKSELNSDKKEKKKEAVKKVIASMTVGEYSVTVWFFSLSLMALCYHIRSLSWIHHNYYVAVDLIFN